DAGPDESLTAAARQRRGDGKRRRNDDVPRTAEERLARSQLRERGRRAATASRRGHAADVRPERRGTTLRTDVRPDEDRIRGRGDSGTERASERTEERHVDPRIADERVRPADDAALAARELVLHARQPRTGARLRHDDPRPRDRDADLEPAALP